MDLSHIESGSFSYFIIIFEKLVYDSNYMICYLMILSYVHAVN